MAAAMSAVTLLLGNGGARGSSVRWAVRRLGLRCRRDFRPIRGPATSPVTHATRRERAAQCWSRELKATFVARSNWHAFGLSSTAGQANVPTTSMPGGDAPPAFPDRVSGGGRTRCSSARIFINREDRSYKARLFHGLRMGIPSLERPHRARFFDCCQQPQWRSCEQRIGMHALLDGEIPLAASAANSCRCELSVRLCMCPRSA